MTIHNLNSINAFFIGAFITFAVLVSASVLYFILSCFCHKLQSREVADRIITWWLIAFIFYLSAGGGIFSITCLFMLLSTLSLYELKLMNAFSKRSYILLLLTTVIFYMSISFVNPKNIIYLTFIVFFIFIIESLTDKHNKFIVASSASAVVIGLGFIVLLVSDHKFNVGYLFFLVILTEINDVMQFLWGKSLGKTKITPVLSPNKTLEGLIGGIISTSAIAILLAPLLIHASYSTSALLGLVISLAGFFGDLFFSYIKRSKKVKESGTFLPGHGGIIDRIDSLSFSAPAFYLILNIY